jgi:hypothetical protein
MPRTDILYDKRAAGRDYVDVDFSFAPNGSSAVAATSNRGKGLYSVARDSAGVFTCTFTADYAALVCATATLQLAASDDKFVQIGTFTAGTAAARATLVVRILDNAAGTIAVADVAADANNRVHVRCTFRKGSITP